MVHALHYAFVSALAAGLKVSAAAALAGALVAPALIGPPRTHPAEQTVPTAQGGWEAARPSPAGSR